MPLYTEKYDQSKIDRIKRILEQAQAKGAPKPFEIFVDNMKVVEKTDDVREFDNYEEFMSHDTSKIKILVYNTAHSPRNDQYCFTITGHHPESSEGLSGVESIVQQRLNERDREHELARLKLQVEESKQKLDEAEGYIDLLEEKLQHAGDDKYKLKNIDLLDSGVALLGRYAERNPSVLAGLGLPPAPSNIPVDAVSDEEGAMFEKVDSRDQNSHDDQYITVLKQLEAAFTPQELLVVMQVIGKMTEDKAHLDRVAELLQIKP